MVFSKIKIFAYITICLLGLWALGWRLGVWSLVTHRGLQKITMRNTDFFVTLADTPLTRYRGLSGQKTLAEREGMLFVFPQPVMAQFVMRDMLFPLDFIWIHENSIVDITENVPIPISRDLPLATYRPNQGVTHVLEVGAGTVKKFGLQIGDRITGVDRIRTLR